MQLLRTLLSFIAWPLRLLLFLLLAILASLNLHESTVFLFLGHQWRAPMAVLLLIAFASGAVLGVVAVVIRRARKPTQGLATPMSPESDKLNKLKANQDAAYEVPSESVSQSYDSINLQPQSVRPQSRL
jgi:lipopolysaccharide assembly protein A